MRDLKQKLVEMAHEKGICAEGFKRMLGSADLSSLIAYYVENPDWCMERDFPSLETLRLITQSSRSAEDAEEYGIYVDREFNGELLNDRQVYIFHHCSGWIQTGLNMDKAIIPMLYFGNGSRMEVSGVSSQASGYEISPCDKPADAIEEEKRGKVRVPIYIFGENWIGLDKGNGVEFREFTQRAQGNFIQS